MRTYILFVILLIGLVLPVISIEVDDVVGLWRGDKALGDVEIRKDGTGMVVFDGNPDLKMRIRVNTKGEDIIVTQAEKNDIRFYLAFNPFLARPLTYEQARILEQKARPMKWVFSLNRSRDRLIGTKYTTGWHISGSDFQVNNNYSRPSEWERLATQLEKPKIQVEGPKSVKLITLTHEDPKATIHYTIDGSAPVQGQAKFYQDPFSLKESTTVQAMASRQGYMTSPAVAEDVLIEKLEPNKDITNKTLGLKKEKEKWLVEILEAYRTPEGYVAIKVRHTNLGEEARNRYVTDWYNHAHFSGKDVEADRVMVNGEYTGFTGSLVAPQVSFEYILEFPVDKGVMMLDALNLGRGWLFFNNVPVN